MTTREHPPTELDLVYDDLKQAQARIEQLEAALWVFIGVFRAPSSYLNDAYELHVNRVEYEKACAALAPKQDK